MLERLPKGWVNTTLGEVCAMNPRPSHDELPSEETEVSFVPMAAVEEESGRLDATETRTLAAVRKSYTPFNENDVIFAKITPCMENGKIALATGLKNGIAYGSTEYFVFRPYEGLLPRFVLHFLLQPSFRQEAQHRMTGAVGQKRVPSHYLAVHSFPLPPTREQERIVAKLDSTLARVAKGEAAARRALVRLQRYRAAVLHAAVTGELTRDWRKSHPPEETGEQLLKRLLAERRTRWEEAELKRLQAAGKPPKDEQLRRRYPVPCVTQRGANAKLPRGWTWASIEQASLRVTVGHVGPMKTEYVKQGIPFLRSQNIRTNRFDPAGLQFIRPSFHTQLQKSKVIPGDVAVVRSGVNAGMTCVVPESLVEANCADLVLVQRPLIDPHFLSFYMNSAAQHDVAAIKVGVAQAHFNTGTVASLPVAVPPKAEQTQIVLEVERCLAAADRLASALNYQLERAQVARQSLLREAFDGNLVPQDSNDEPASFLLERIRAARKAEAKKPKVNRMPKAKAKITRRPLLDVLSEHKRPISPEQLFHEAGFQPGEADSFYRELASLREQLREKKPSGAEARAWPQRAKVSLKMKEH